MAKKQDMILKEPRKQSASGSKKDSDGLDDPRKLSAELYPLFGQLHSLHFNAIEYESLTCSL